MVVSLFARDPANVRRLADLVLARQEKPDADEDEENQNKIRESFSARVSRRWSSKWARVIDAENNMARSSGAIRFAMSECAE